VSATGAKRSDTVADLIEIGNRERAAEDVEAAAETFAQILRVDSENVDGHIGLGWVRSRQRYYVDAARHYLTAAKGRPLDPWLYAEAGRLHLLNFTPEDAVGPLLRARELEPGQPDLDVDIGRAYVALGDPASAIPYFDEADGLRPGDPSIVTHLANAHAEVGDFDRAAELLRTVIDLGGEVPYALFRLALTSRGESATRLLPEIDAQLAEVGQRSRQAMLLHQGAFKVRLDAGDFPAAYEHLTASKQLTRRPAPRGERERLADQTMRIFTKEFLASRGDWGDTSETPVFVIGMPRSGSTLVETVLAAHPSVTSLGERNYVDIAAHQLWYGNGAPTEYERRVRALQRDGVQALAADYLDRTRMLTPRGRRAINKMLPNYQHVGLIRLMFPRARFIFCRRSPLDACWSIYSNPIEHGHPYASSMDELAWQYALSLRYLEHWRREVPGSTLEIEYEVFVGDLQHQAERLLAFLGLPWTDDCLRFQEQDRVVQTMSYQQVRQGLYTSSIGRWRAHREYLQPLIDALLAQGVIAESDLDDPATGPT
jgi:tetratricopeptide (TPR) repeat protein